MAPDPQSNPEQAIERDTENLEEDLGRLGNRIDEAKSKLADRAQEAGNADEVEAAGDDAEGDDD